MDEIEPGKPAIEAAPRGWPLFLAGGLLFVLGPLGYYVQIRSRNLGAPWYSPILSTFGVVLMILAVRRRGGVPRVLGVALFAFVCGLEWFTLLVATKSPAYTGQAQPGRMFPAFTATSADGKPFTENDLDNGNPTVLVFYRGRW